MLHDRTVVCKLISMIRCRNVHVPVISVHIYIHCNGFLVQFCRCVTQQAIESYSHLTNLIDLYNDPCKIRNRNWKNELQQKVGRNQGTNQNIRKIEEIQAAAHCMRKRERELWHLDRMNGFEMPFAEKTLIVLCSPRRGIAPFEHSRVLVAFCTLICSRCDRDYAFLASKRGKCFQDLPL